VTAHAEARSEHGMEGGGAVCRITEAIASAGAGQYSPAQTKFLWDFYAERLRLRRQSCDLSRLIV
jgi:hypothetical protein